MTALCRYPIALIGLAGIALLASAANQSDWIGAYYSISSAELTATSLVVELHYSGGCEDHHFRLVTVLDAPTTEVLRIKIVHSDNDDHCKRLMTETIKFDLRELLSGYPRVRIIELSHWPVPITVN